MSVVPSRLIESYDAEVELFRTMIAHRFRGHRGYRVIQQISRVGPTFAEKRANLCMSALGVRRDPAMHGAADA